MALLSSGCRATVDGLTNVQSSSTTQQWQATSLDDNNLHVPCRQSSKHFISGQLKVFRYSAIPRFTVSQCLVCTKVALLLASTCCKLQWNLQKRTPSITETSTMRTRVRGPELFSIL